jgi:hypothetical protein
MSRQPADLRGSTLITRRHKGVADVIFVAGLIGCMLADPGPAGKITERFPCRGG